MFRLLKYLKPYLWQTGVLLVAVAVQVWGSLQLPALMAEIINDGIVAGNPPFIWQTGLKMLGLALMSALAALVASYFSAMIGTSFARDIRADLFKKVISFSIMDMKDFSTASLITRTTNDINQVQQVTVMILMLMLRAPMTIAIAIYLAITTAPDMTWIIALASVIILVIVISILSAVLPKFKIFQKLIDKITMITRENLTGLRVVRAFNNQKVEKRKFERANDELTRTLLFIDKLLELQNPLINLVFNGTTLLCTWIGISLLTKDVAYLGNMLAFAQYATQVVMAFLMMSLLFVMIPRANVSAGRINEVLKVKPRVHWREKTLGRPDKVPSVEFRNVDFAYNQADEEILADISFVARAGQTTAFIGSTGSGKSTLVNLIPRFFEPTTGEILVNGLRVDHYSAEDLIRRIGFVPQRGMLFSGTIKSNIMFGAPDASMADVKRAAEIAEAKEFIEKMPEKYDSHVSQGGTNVSGGQKQRISIARAICKQPDIYVFDDSFSALDMKTDQKLRTALKGITKNAVVLIVAQRISTIKDADQIIVLDQGRIAGQGTHEKLLNECEVYREIVRSQLSEQEYKAELREAKNAR